MAVHHHRMTGFVIGHDALFFFADQAALALRAGNDALDRFFKLGLADDFLVAAGSQDGAFIDQVFQVSADKTGRRAGQNAQVNLGSQRFALDMHLQDGFASAHIRPVENHAAVKATGAQQGRVEDIRAVGGSHDDDVGIGIETVHLNQHLVQGLLALVVAAAQTGAALAADRIDFIDEDDAGRMALGLVEQVAHAAGADAHEHFNEFRTGDREERHAGFTRDGFGDQGFTGSWRANQQNAFGNARAELDEFLRLAQEFDHFFQFFLGLHPRRPHHQR